MNSKITTFFNKPRATKKAKSNTRTKTKRKAQLSDPMKYTEMRGLLIFSAGVLVFLSILSYHPTDPVFWETSRINQYAVNNWLNIIGATIAKFFFAYTFGYASLIFPMYLMAYGLAVMVKTIPYEVLNRVSLIALFWAYFVALVLAMPESLMTGGFSRSYYPSGLLGGITTDMITRFFGRFALVFLSAIYLLILLMITFDFRISLISILLGRGVQSGASFVTDSSKKLAASFKNVSEKVKDVQWLPETPESNPVATAEKDKETSPDYFDEDDYATPVAGFDEVPSEENVTMPGSKAADYLPPSELTQEPPPPVPERDIRTVDEPVPEHVQQFPLPEGNYAEEEGIVMPGTQTELDFQREQERIDYDAQVDDALSKYQLPPLDFLDEDESNTKVSREELMANADLLENTLAQFNVKAFVKKVIEGPVITLYAVRPAEGVKINQVVSLSDDLALAMRAKGIRMIAPIPGEAAIGIEIPNRRPSTVYFKTVMKSDKFANHKGQLVLGMGKTIGGEIFCADLARMPHLLIAGATGAGKSVGVNTMIASILYRVPPSDVKFVMIDPKKLELSLYAKLKDHYLAYCPDIDEIVITHPQNAILVLKSVVNEMEERYDILSKMGVRDIVSYNARVQQFRDADDNPEHFRKLPYIVVIIDELADLILTASREVEEPITRLAQMARAVGIHLIVATQRPSVDILTGLIKANFPTRIAYQVATRPDSKTILDMFGAEKLIGNGDLLFLPPGTGKPVRLQNPYVSTEEVEKIIKHVQRQPKFPPYELKLIREKAQPSAAASKKVAQDDLFERAKEIVIRHQQGSISLLQRKLKVGYARAARLIDELEEDGVVGPGQGSKARDVLISSYGEDQ